MIEELLSGDATEPPRQLHHLLQLLLESSTEQGIAVTSPTARSYLTALKAASPSSKQGRLATQLLALTAAGSGAVRAAALDFVRARVERAERWQAARR